MAQKQVIWILADSFPHIIGIAKQHDLEFGQLECLTVTTLYRLRGTILPVVLIPECQKLDDIMIDRLKMRDAVIINVRCDLATH